MAISRTTANASNAACRSAVRLWCLFESYRANHAAATFFGRGRRMLDLIRASHKNAAIRGRARRLIASRTL